MVENINIGVIKTVLSNKIVNEFISESTLKNTKGLTKKFVELIKSNPVLQEEYEIYENLNNKFIMNDSVGLNYINENISKLKKYNIKDINKAHNLLTNFISENKLVFELNSKVINKNNLISDLINESIKPNGDINKKHHCIDLLIESFKTNINNVKPNSNDYNEYLNEGYDSDMLISIATKKYNEKFSSLNESDRNIIKKVVFGSKDDIKELFENLKRDNIITLKETNPNGIDDKINEALDKLNKMEYSEENIIEQIISLNTLSNNLKNS